MGSQRKRYPKEFKAKVAVEAIKGERTINQIASHYGVHTVPVHLESDSSVVRISNIESYLNGGNHHGKKSEALLTPGEGRDPSRAPDRPCADLRFV